MSITFEPPVQYLRDCSDTSLHLYEVSKLEHVSNLRRELRALWEEMLEESALAHLARWMIENRADLRSNTRSIEPSLVALGEPSLAALGEPSLAELGEPPAGTGPSKTTLADPAELQVPDAARPSATPHAVGRGPVLVELAKRSSPPREPDSSSSGA